MVIIMNRIPVARGREQDFEKTFAERDRAVDRMPGFIDMQVAPIRRQHLFRPHALEIH